MPFFCFKGKMFCYLWFHKKLKQPYIGIVEGNRFEECFLLQENRSRMKIMLLDPNKDLPIKTIQNILQRAINFYKKNGFVEFDKHVFKLGNDEQTDIMMKLKLNY